MARWGEVSVATIIRVLYCIVVHSLTEYVMVGVSSSKILDALGKGFAEFIRDVHVAIPKKFL